MTSNILNSENSVLLIIDIQPRLLAAQPKGEKILKNTKKLAAAARLLNIKTIVTEQYPQVLGITDETLSVELPSDTKTFEKKCFNCLEQPELKEYLTALGKKQIILCGVETHICVHQTAAALITEGFEVHIIEDACGSRDKFEHKLGLKRMMNDGASPSSVEIALFELLKNASHPKFKEVQSLIK